MKYPLALFGLLLSLAAGASGFDTNFLPQTLRFDIAASGYGPDTQVRIDSIATWPGWYGRRVNLTRELYPEVVQVVVTDDATADTLYVDSKSPEQFSSGPDNPLHISLFVPKPRRSATVHINFYNYSRTGRKRNLTVRQQLPAAALEAMRPNEAAPLPYTTLRRAEDPSHALNLALLAEGFTADEMDSFLHHAARLDSALFCQPGFRDNARRFNVVAVMLPSPESGLTIPSQDITVNSALGAHFDSYGLERLVTVPDTRRIWDALRGIPASQVLVVANSTKYGGSGSYNEYAIAAADRSDFTGVIIHEFGHSFIWLGDEYEQGGYEDTYFPDIEPLEPNITTLADFSGKWQNLIDSGEATLIEGAGYQPKGVWRGAEHCLMRAIQDEYFCPVCAQAISRTISYHTAE